MKILFWSFLSTETQTGLNSSEDFLTREIILSSLSGADKSVVKYALENQPRLIWTFEHRHRLLKSQLGYNWIYLLLKKKWRKRFSRDMIFPQKWDKLEYDIKYLSCSGDTYCSVKILSLHFRTFYSKTLESFIVFNISSVAHDRVWVKLYWKLSLRRKFATQCWDKYWGNPVDQTEQCTASLHFEEEERDN